MKTIAKIILLTFISLSLTYCSDDGNNETPLGEMGTIEIKWDNM